LIEDEDLDLEKVDVNIDAGIIQKPMKHQKDN
jgi:hypothetical protein